MKEIKSLPKSMAEKALWARKEFQKNPSKSQVDDECLVWCFNKLDKLWYSIAGNYSQFSPEEKRLKEYNRQKEYEEKEQTAKEMAIEYYNRVLYQSNIRQMVYDRDDNICQICHKKGDSKLHIHHILKRRHNGTDHLDNLITVCPRCHIQADNKLYDPIWR